LQLGSSSGVNGSVIPPPIEAGNVSGKSWSPERHGNRPGCNNRYHYRRADGRISEIARLFRLGVPIVRAAGGLGSRRATAYRYCKPIRRRRTAARQAELDPTSYTDKPIVGGP